MLNLTLVVVRCRDLESSRRFYEALGLTLTREQHGSGPVHYSAQLGPTVLELYPATKAASTVRLGFAVPNLPAALDATRRAGGRIVREPTNADGTALVRDPDDNAVELTGGHQ